MELKSRFRSFIRRRWEIDTKYDAPGYVPFLYNDIDASREIRILELSPDVGDSSLQGRLVTQKLESSKEYTAVSYTWGNQDKVDKIVCRENDDLRITKSASDVLHHFRDTKNVRRLWIDAICINQTDRDEHKQQLLVMNGVYSQAKAVLIWLGQADSTTEQAFDMIHVAYEACLTAQKSFGNYPTLDQLFESGLPTGDDAKWSALDQLLRRSWFQRTWPLQEVALAQNAILNCGQHSCNWLELAHTALTLHQIEAHRTLPIRCLPLAARIAMISLPEITALDHSLFSLLIATAGLSVTQLEDKVYALLGLASDRSDFTKLVKHGPCIRPLFTEVSAHYLAKEVYSILNAAGLYLTSYGNPHGLPSWVPDWTLPVRLFNLSMLGWRGRETVLSSGQPRVGADGRTLHIRGFVKDTVRAVGADMPMNETLDSNICIRPDVHEWEKVANRVKVYPTGEPVWEAFARTLVVKPADAIDLDTASACAAYRTHQAGLTSYTEITDMAMACDPSVISEYQNVLRKASMGRTFFITRSGHFGLGPAGTRRKDLLVELHGSITPFVIRPQRGRRYALIGEVYIHGMMKVKNVAEDRCVDLELI